MNYATKEEIWKYIKEMIETTLDELAKKALKEEEPQKEVWELYPDYRSCVNDDDNFYYYTSIGGINAFKAYYGNRPFSCFTEKLAKRQLAELQLAKIADKWGEGIKAEDIIYFPVCSLKNNIRVYQCYNFDNFYMSLPFYFKTLEQCKKSIELHQQLWKDWFMVD